MQPITMNQHSHPTTGAVTTPLKDIRKTLPLRVLSDADWQHWTTHGYVIVRQAVPAEKVARLVDLLWQFDEKDPADPSTWDTPQRRDHAMIELNHTGMLEIYNHQYLWDTRTDPRVYDAFVDIWDREDLWVDDRSRQPEPAEEGEGQSERVHPLGRGHHAAAAADRRAGRAEPRDAGRRGRRLPVRAGTVLRLRVVGADAAGRPRSDASRHHRAATSSTCRWRPATC